MNLRRWDGYSKPLMKFIHEIYVLCYHLLSEENRKTLNRAVLEHTVVFLNIITGLNLDTVRKFDESPQLQSFIAQMKRNTLSFIRHYFPNSVRHRITEGLRDAVRIKVTCCKGCFHYLHFHICSHEFFGI